jgi:hypothetical protein
MEALSSLTFKGSLPEAIFEAKGKKKLFVVYISGEDEESDKLNRLTWTDASVGFSCFYTFHSLPLLLKMQTRLFFTHIIIVCFLIKVADSLSKYCILVHIQAGSVDATNFSAICILSFYQRT